MKKLIVLLTFASCTQFHAFRKPNAELPKLNEFSEKELRSKEKYLSLKTFKLNQGVFKHSYETVVDYYSNTVSYIKPKSIPNSRWDHYSLIKYKVNRKNELQAFDYYLQDFHEMQSFYDTDIDEYKEANNNEFFIDAKREFYSKLKFDRKTYRHEKPYLYLKEWGGLNHPPFHSLPRDISKLDSRFAKNVDKEIYNHRFLDESFQNQLDQISGTQLSIGNKLKLYADKESFEKKLEMISAAKSHVWMSTLAYICDVGGFRFSDLVLKKAQEGVKFNIIYDKYVTGVTNIYNKNCIKPLKKHKNIQIIKANDLFKHKGLAIYHVKEIIVDNKSVIMGGQNLIDADSLSRGTDFMNRDIDIYFEGPMVLDVAKQFVDTWEYFRTKSYFKKKKYKSLKPYLSEISKIESTYKTNNKIGLNNYGKWLNDKETIRSKGMCRYVAQSPTQSPSRVAKVMIPYLSNTNNYLGIVNPMQYDSLSKLKKKFNHLKEMLTIIDEKQKNGLAMDLLTSQVDMSANEFVPVLRERIKKSMRKGNIPLANLRQWEMDKFNKHEAKKHFPNLISDFVPYDNTHVWMHISFIHSKIYYMDRLATFVGSMNLNSNATDQAWESGVYCLDESLNKQIEEMFILDKMNSIPLIYRN